jgi:hypothetical protein
MQLVESLVIPCIVGIFTGVISGYLTSYAVGRHFEFKTYVLRATYCLRHYPNNAQECIGELTLCMHQLTSQGFYSAIDPINIIIDWAEEHKTDSPELEPEGKRETYMPMLEKLRPTCCECLPTWKRKEIRLE